MFRREKKININQKFELDHSWTSVRGPMVSPSSVSLSACLPVCLCLFAIFPKNCSLDFSEFLHDIRGQ